MYRTVKGWEIVPASEEEIEVENAVKVVLDDGETVLVYPPKGCENVQVPAEQLKAFVEACKKNGISYNEEKVKKDLGQEM